MNSSVSEFSTRRLVAAMAALTLVALGTPIIIGSPALREARADGSSMTVTGTENAWDAVNQQPMSSLPTATVTQTSNLVDQVVHVSWANETPSSNSTFDPTPVTGTTFQPGSTIYAVEVVECKGAAPATFDDCYSALAGSTIGAHGLGNAVQTITQADGTGFVDMHIETGVTNDLLGCDATHPCSVAVLPAWGGVAPSDGSALQCNDHSQDYQTEANGYNGTTALDANLGAACSWADRIIVPLSFASTPANCPAATPAFSSAGSPMLARAMDQWQAGWCTGAGSLSFAYDSSSNEYQARSSFLSGGGALTSSTDLAFTTQAAQGGIRKFTYAPVANTSIAVAFLIDDPATGKLIPHLNLDARLVAKLLTTSYSGSLNCDGVPLVSGISCDPAVYGNPTTLFTDKEFLALNPTLSALDFPLSNNQILFGAEFPTVVGGNSDLTYELTRWIASDPSARAFLAGQPDGSGMRVNDHYKGLTQYPTSQLVNLDPGYVDPASPPGNGTMQNAWQPVSGLDRVGTTLVGNGATALNSSCLTGDSGICSYPKINEQLGSRALFAIMDQGQATAYQFPTASLVNVGGVAVSPTVESISAGLTAATTNADGITKSPNLTSTNPAIYPLSVTDYAMVPTCGLSTAAANGVSTFLAKVGSSQTYGVQPGTIAPGYLALTDDQLTQLAKARSAVSTSACNPTPAPVTIPPVTAPPAQNQGGSGTTVTPSSPAPATAAPTLSSAPSGSASSSPGATKAVANVGIKPADSAGPLRFALPILLIAGLLMLLAGPGLYLAFATGVGPAALAWLRGLRGGA